MVTTNLFRNTIMAAMTVFPFAKTTWGLRKVMYYDDGHPQLPSNTTVLKGITHIVISFADPAFLVNGTKQTNFPFTDIAALRQKFDAGTKIGVAIGGWEWTPGFFGVTTPGNLDVFVSSTKDMVDRLGLDFIDIDWEYPGGDGIDYKTKSAEDKNAEVQVFPQLLEKLKATLGDKELSVAVPGKPEDIDVYKSDNTQRIWNAVDFVNVMTYDLMNRRDTITAHSSSLKGANATIQKYIEELSLAPEKISLGFPLYAKYFELVASNDCKGPLGCPILAAETTGGADAYTSDYVNFEEYNLVKNPVQAEGDGTCGPLDINSRCSNGACCSRYGNCGTTPDFCGHMCLTNFGYCAPGPDMVKSFQKAIENGIMDEVEGAMWYIDTISTSTGTRKFFWSWESTEVIQRKIQDIVKAYNLGGVMAWSLGQDSAGTLIGAITAA